MTLKVNNITVHVTLKTSLSCYGIFIAVLLRRVLARLFLRVCSRDSHYPVPLEGIPKKMS